LSSPRSFICLWRASSRNAVSKHVKAAPTPERNLLVVGKRLAKPDLYRTRYKMKATEGVIAIARQNHTNVTVEKLEHKKIAAICNESQNLNQCIYSL